MLPTALSIAGSDSGAGAGIQADLLTFAANGVYGTTAITCLTAQNPDGVGAIHPCPPEVIREQILQVTRFYPVKAAKTGMLHDVPTIRAVVSALAAAGDIPLVVDPVMVASSGARLLETDAVEALTRELIPLAAVVTPNLDEAEILLGRRPRETGAGQALDGAELARKLGVAVLLKGGHARGDRLRDALVESGGRILAAAEATRVPGVDTHGSGCTLSAAVAARLARGDDLAAAFSAAHAYLQAGLADPLRAGPGLQIRHLG